MVKKGAKKTKVKKPRKTSKKKPTKKSAPKAKPKKKKEASAPIEEEQAEEEIEEEEIEEEPTKEKPKNKQIHITLPRFGKKFIIITASILLLIIIGVGIYFLIPVLTPEEEIICTTTRIMPLGDSITLGSGTDTLDGYRKDLYFMLQAENYSFNFVGDYNHGTGEWDLNHEGISGQIISWYRTRMTGPDDFVLTRNTPDTILYFMGINDLAKGGEIEKYLGELNDTLKVIYNFNENATVLLAQITTTGNDNFNIRVEEYNDGMDDISNFWNANGKALTLVDMENILEYPDDFYDEIHPNEEGYKKIAEAWYTPLAATMTPC
jgi:lysophospholipase L1-like esterase